MTQVMIDVTGGNLPGLLQALQARYYPGVLAGYVTGTLGVDWPAFYWTQLTGHTGLFRIDQSPGLSLFASGGADAADVEAGAADLGEAVKATQGREERGWYSWWYVEHNDGPYGLSQARQHAQAAGYKRVQYWVADWSMSLATAQAFLAANPDVSAVQWASPSTNPSTLVPGTQNTLAELGVDLSVARDGWFDPPRLPAPPRTLESVTVGFSDGSAVKY
jgi:hypothetical protein